MSTARSSIRSDQVSTLFFSNVAVETLECTKDVQMCAGCIENELYEAIKSQEIIKTRVGRDRYAK